MTKALPPSEHLSQTARLGLVDCEASSAFLLQSLEIPTGGAMSTSNAYKPSDAAANPMPNFGDPKGVENSAVSEGSRYVYFHGKGHQQQGFKKKFFSGAVTKHCGGGCGDGGLVLGATALGSGGHKAKAVTWGDVVSCSSGSGVQSSGGGFRDKCFLH
jgi:hypothetical protein